MKILITILLALFISSNAFALTALEIMEKGSLMGKSKVSPQVTQYEYIYQSKYYVCEFVYVQFDKSFEADCFQAMGKNKEIEEK